MDPNACLRLLLDACGEGARETARTCLLDLHAWLAKGGALPQDPRSWVALAAVQRATKAGVIAASRDPDLSHDERALISHGLLRLMGDAITAADVPRAQAILNLGLKIVADMTR